jgi:hypothetical protein
MASADRVEFSWTPRRTRDPDGRRAAISHTRRGTNPVAGDGILAEEEAAAGATASSSGSWIRSTARTTTLACRASRRRASGTYAVSASSTTNTLHGLGHPDQGHGLATSSWSTRQPLAGPRTSRASRSIRLDARRERLAPASVPRVRLGRPPPRLRRPRAGDMVLIIAPRSGISRAVRVLQEAGGAITTFAASHSSRSTSPLTAAAGLIPRRESGRPCGSGMAAASRST